MKQNSWATHAGCALEERGGVRPAPGHDSPLGGDSGLPAGGLRFSWTSPGEETGPCSLPSGFEGRRNEEGP